MACIPFSQLLYIDFDIRHITFHHSTFPNGDIVDYNHSGRNKNLLHLITSGSRSYSMNGNSFRLGTGEVLFMPDGTKYITTAFPQGNALCSGIGILFDLIDQNGMPIQLEPVLLHDWKTPASSLAPLFFDLENCLVRSDCSILHSKSILFRLLYLLASDQIACSSSFALIKPAITYIAEHFRENLSVQTYAQVCCVSESYFRKKFNECTGMSPIEYRNRLRFTEARKLFMNEHLNIQEIAEQLGFSDASYFTKLYKKYNGASLKNDHEIV